MNTLIYFLGRLVIRSIQCLPLRWVARLGRLAGGMAFHLDGRHRRVALQNLTRCFGSEKSPAEIEALARENFRRIGENYMCAVKTAGMSFEQLQPHLEFTGFEKLPPRREGRPAPNIVAAIGHFGNFELYARIQNIRPDLQGAGTYRALKQSGATRLLNSLRTHSGCRFFERRTEGAALRQLLNARGVLVGLMVDQHARGWHGPFLGHLCHTNLAAAILASRYGCELFSIICHRVGLAKWRLEVGTKIETHTNGDVRSSESVMQEVNQAMETAVRQDPANWFWVHRRWKDLKVRAGKNPTTVPCPHTAADLEN